MWMVGGASVSELNGGNRLPREVRELSWCLLPSRFLRMN